MQKLMMPCHMKDEKLYVPEYIISIHFCKIELVCSKNFILKRLCSEFDNNKH